MLSLIEKALTVKSFRAFLCVVLFSVTAACSESAVNLSDPAAIYNNYCFACHDTGAVGAPLLSNKAFWQAASEDKMRLYQVTLKGFEAMPAKGTCLSCSDEQLKQVVDWMLVQ